MCSALAAGLVERRVTVEFLNQFAVQFAFGIEAQPAAILRFPAHTADLAYQVIAVLIRYPQQVALVDCPAIAGVSPFERHTAGDIHDARLRIALDDFKGIRHTMRNDFKCRSGIGRKA